MFIMLSREQPTFRAALSEASLSSWSGAMSSSLDIRGAARPAESDERCCPRHPDWPSLAQHLLDEFPDATITSHHDLDAWGLTAAIEYCQPVTCSLSAFVKLRELLSTHREFSVKLGQLEAKLQNHDEQIIDLIDAIRSLMEPPEAPAKPPIGYQSETRKRRK